MLLVVAANVSVSDLDAARHLREELLVEELRPRLAGDEGRVALLLGLSRRSGAHPRQDLVVRDRHAELDSLLLEPGPADEDRQRLSLEGLLPLRPVCRHRLALLPQLVEHLVDQRAHLLRRHLLVADARQRLAARASAGGKREHGDGTAGGPAAPPERASPRAKRPVAGPPGSRPRSTAAARRSRRPARRRSARPPASCG